MKLRKISPIKYYEAPEPAFDEYVYCDKCADFVYEYCSVHGPLLVIPDDKVPVNSNYPPFVPRSALTIPKVFLHIAHSIIPGAGLGVFSTLTIPRGVRFGPYHGVNSTDVDSLYCWQLHGEDRTRTGVVDASDANASNWMRYVNCARHWCEQNLVAYQYQGQIYYRTIKIIPRFTELLVFYGGEYARLLDVNMKQYDNEEYYTKIKEQSIIDVTTQKRYIANNEDKPMYENVAIDETIISTNTHDTTNEVQRNCNNEIENYAIVEEDETIEDDLFHTSLDPSLTVYPPSVQYDQNNQTFQIDFNNYSFPNSSENTTNNFDTNNNNFCHTINKVHRSTEVYVNDQQRLRCHLCPLTTNYKENLRLHLRKLHKINSVHLNELTEMNGIGDRNCQLCSFKSMYTSSLHRHIKKVHGQSKVDQKPETKIQKAEEQNHKCKLCSFKTNNNNNVRRHMNRVHKIFAQASKVEQDTNENCLKCPLCAFTTKLRENIRRHIKRQHSDQHIDTYKQFNLMKVHESSVGLHKCNLCSFTSESRDSIQRHLSSVHNKGVKRYKCTYCEYKTNYKSKSNQHLNRHTKEFMFICDLCSHTVYNKTDLARHIKNHHRETAPPTAC